MANPQKENGYLSIANEIVDRLIGLGLSGREYEVVLFVIRKTYGFNKKEDRIAISQFERGLGIHRSTACKLINSLVAKRLLVKREGVYNFNKNWEQWQVVAKRPLVAKSPQSPNGNSASRHLANEVVAKSPPTKDIVTKDNITKDNSPLPPKGGSTAKAVAAKNQKPEKTEEEKVLDQQVIAILEAFQKSVNPGLSYGHKTNRESAKWMIDKWGFERTMKLVEYAISIHGEEFAPTVATPYDLKVGYAKVSAYYKRHAKEQNKNQITII